MKWRLSAAANTSISSSQAIKWHERRVKNLTSLEALRSKYEKLSEFCAQRQIVITFSFIIIIMMMMNASRHGQNRKLTTIFSGYCHSHKTFTPLCNFLIITAHTATKQQQMIACYKCACHNSTEPNVFHIIKLALVCRVLWNYLRKFYSVQFFIWHLEWWRLALYTMMLMIMMMMSIK